MLRLHHAPMACSLASRLALTEAGLPHEVAIVRTWNREQDAPAYRAINPRGQVPALQTDQGVLTESTAILPYIADLAPEKGLFPKAGTFARAQGQAWLSFLSSSLHVALASAMFAPDATAKATALPRAAAAFQDIENHLEGRDHLLDRFSVADLYLLVFALWRASPTLGGGLPALPNLDRVQQGLIVRPGLMAIVAEDMKTRSEA